MQGGFFLLRLPAEARRGERQAAPALRHRGEGQVGSQGEGRRKKRGTRKMRFAGRKINRPANSRRYRNRADVGIRPCERRRLC